MSHTEQLRKEIVGLIKDVLDQYLDDIRAKKHFEDSPSKMPLELKIPSEHYDKNLYRATFHINYVESLVKINLNYSAISYTKWRYYWWFKPQWAFKVYVSPKPFDVSELVNRESMWEDSSISTRSSTLQPIHIPNDDVQHILTCVAFKRKRKIVIDDEHEFSIRIPKSQSFQHTLDLKRKLQVILSDSDAITVNPALNELEDRIMELAKKRINAGLGIERLGLDERTKLARLKAIEKDFLNVLDRIVDKLVS